MRKNLLFIIIFAFGVIFAADASAQTVSGSISKGAARKGRVTRGYVVLRIPKGLHVNSYRPKSEYAIPTRVSISGVGARAYGVTYPPGKMRKFSFSDDPISVYEGKAVFGFKVTVPKNSKRKTIKVKANVRYQACTDEVCYAPRTKTIWITARVR